MNVLILGRGSAARRNREALGALGHGFVDKVEDADIVVIASLTPNHLRDLKALEGYGKRCVVEKPLFQNAEDYKPPFPTWVGYQLRFHPNIIKLKKNLEGVTVRSAHIYGGAALKYWKGSYHSDREQGGGVLRDFSHELDLIQWLFGPFEIHSGIVSHDIACMILEAEKCPAITLQVNYYDEIPRREWMVNTDAGTFFVDLTGQSYECTKAMYEDILSGEGNACTFSEALAINKFIDMLEK